MVVEQEPGRRAPDGSVVVVRRRPWRRVASAIALGVLALLVVAIAILWLERRTIATHFLKSEFERRGVSASYRLDRIGLRTQEVSNLVIGDPRRPDLVARHAIIQMRIKLNGGFEVYRIVARGVRLRGALVGGKVHWGQIDKLLPPPSNKPFQLPRISLDIADSTIALATPFGPVGIALQGDGNLRGGFKGRAALSSPLLIPGRCRAEDLKVNVALSVVATRPHVDGPVALDRLICPTSHINVEAPRFEAKASFNESFTRVDGSGRMAMASLVAGSNGLANFAGDLTYAGPLEDVRGRVKLSAQNSRLATIYADRTRMDAAYALGIRSGKLTILGKFAADSAKLDPSMLAGVTEPLAAAQKTPIGPVATAMVNAIRRTANNFNISGGITAVNFPGGGGVRISNANLIGPQGARARIFGGSGVTYYWPAGGLRIDSNIETAGGGLPNARVTVRQPKAGAPISGVADVAPYSVGATRLALAPIRFRPGPANSTLVTTVAQLDGPFPDGRVEALRLPIDGRVGQSGSFALGTSCAVVSFNYLRMSSLQLGRTRLPVCPIGSAIITKPSGGGVSANARITHPVLDGHLGKSPFHLDASLAEARGQQFMFSNLATRLGRPQSPIVFDAARLGGNFGGSQLRGTFTGAKATIGNVPLLLSEGSGSWTFNHGDLSADAKLTVSDRAADPRFYPLSGDNVHLSLAGDYVRATGTLRHPATGTRVTDVSIEHQLSSGSGHALLDVPGIAFGPGLQPDDLTRLSQGVVALVNGTVSGQGRIDWAGNGTVTSTGDFGTTNMDLAAPFGPVTGLTTTIHFTDLLGLKTAPGQIATVKSINAGIIVNDGVIHYQILPNNLVRIERGEWPFMGGRLILQETVLNFGSPSAKRLTFELQGFNAKMFIDSLGFSGFMISGTFDGVLPMIFDENGGRIVGGRLDARPPGGEFVYSGTKPKGFAAKIATDLLTNIRYRTMVIRLNGDLAGEFATKLEIDGISLGESHGFVAGLVRSAFSKLPLKLNVNINAPFRALIQMAKAFKDPTQVIAPVMPFPIDSPSLKVEVQNMTKQEEQTTVPAPQAAPTTPPSSSPPTGGAK